MDADEVTVEGDDETTVEVDEGDTTVVVATAPESDTSGTDIDHEQRITRLEDAMVTVMTAVEGITERQEVQEVVNEIQSEEIAMVADEVTEADEPTSEPDEPPTSKVHRWWKWNDA